MKEFPTKNLTGKTYGVLTSTLVLVLLLGGCGFECINSVEIEVPSLDGKQVAVVYKRDCGATTRENTQVCLTSRFKKFDPTKERSFFIAETEKPVGVTWTDLRKIKVSASKDGKVFRKDNSVADCTIEYEWR